MLQISGGSVSLASYRDMDGAGELVGITLHLELFALRKKKEVGFKRKGIHGSDFILHLIWFLIGMLF